MPIIKKETSAVQPCTVYEIAAQAADNPDTARAAVDRRAARNYPTVVSLARR